MDSIAYTLQLLYGAVKRSAVSPDQLVVGDYIVVMGAEDDDVGVVEELLKEGKIVNIKLGTSIGTKMLSTSKSNFIHIIRRAKDMLRLRNHRDYERDLKNMLDKDHQYDGRPEYGPEVSSEKSNLPASKISLSLKAEKEG